ncbi:MAG: hypothetical protein GXC76_14330, partial [Rhodanobacteraceae bacterium]|nr:hypothetical protein [Rhodanobacteraceae bacterium]
MFEFSILSYANRVRRLALGLLLGAFLLAKAGSLEAATTYYVRADGGTAAQCTGRSDAPYPGSGT